MIEKIKKLDLFLSKLISSKFTVILLSSLIFILLFFMFFNKDINYNGLLKEIANINITIAIGLGALSIATTHKILGTDYIWAILVMLLLGIFSYLLAVASLGEGVSKLYFYANVFYIVKIITLFSRYFVQLIEIKDNSPKNNHSSMKRRK